MRLIISTFVLLIAVASPARAQEWCDSMHVDHLVIGGDDLRPIAGIDKKLRALGVSPR